MPTVECLYVNGFHVASFNSSNDTQYYILCDLYNMYCTVASSSWLEKKGV